MSSWRRLPVNTKNDLFTVDGYTQRHHDAVFGVSLGVNEDCDDIVLRQGACLQLSELFGRAALKSLREI